MKLKDSLKNELTGINRYINISRYVPQPRPATKVRPATQTHRHRSRQGSREAYSPPQIQCNRWKNRPALFPGTQRFLSVHLRGPECFLLCALTPEINSGNPPWLSIKITYLYSANDAYTIVNALKKESYTNSCFKIKIRIRR